MVHDISCLTNYCTGQDVHQCRQKVAGHVMCASELLQAMTGPCCCRVMVLANGRLNLKPSRKVVQ